jgi:carboxymethylenebutenolidase
VRIELPSGTPAELARPPSPDREGLGLALAPDIGGLRPLFDDLCARLAHEHGWTVCAIEPFPGREGMALDERLERGMAELDDDRLLGDLAAAADATECARAAVLGFCMGGMYALKAAGTGRFARAVSFYGMVRVPERWRGAGQGEPLDFLGRPGAARLLAILGGRDTWVPPEDADALRAAGAEVVVYPDAEHGFVHDSTRPTHRADDAADAWRRVVAFLTEPDG